MAKEIIKDGTLPMIEKKCVRCGCEFRFDLREVEYLHACDPYSEKMVFCPCCSMAIRLSEEDEINLGLIKILN